MNGLYIRELPPTELARRLAEHIARSRPRDAESLDRATLERAAAISQEKIQTLADFWPLAGFFFERPAEIDPQARERWLDERGAQTLAQARAALAQATRFDEDGVRAVAGGPAGAPAGASRARSTSRCGSR